MKNFMKAVKLIGLVCITGLLGMGIARAEDKAHGKKDPHQGHGHSHDHDHNHDHDHDKSEPSKKSKNSLSEQERRVIRTYVEGHNGRGGGNRGGKGLPPGLAKKVERGEQLPPGWQKKCVPGEIMPVEVFEKCHPLPSELVVKLPAPPAGTVTVTISGQVVRLIRATREILDVFNVHSR